MKTEYNYAIIKESYPELKKESTLLTGEYANKYDPKKKYAMILKRCFKDGSEGIYVIKYSNNLQELHNEAKKFPSWYNYPIGLRKDMQGNINELN